MKKLTRIGLVAAGAILAIALLDTVNDLATRNGAQHAAIAAVDGPYGDRQGLTNEQVVTLVWLAWPQSYGAIVDAIGYPDWRDGDRDYYALPGADWVTITYQGRTAIALDWGWR